MNIKIHKALIKYFQPEIEQKTPYESFLQKELILRDYLAIDRTILANESTFMAYVRTSLNMMVVGMTVFHLVEIPEIQYLSLVFVAIGALILIRGSVKSIRIKRRLSEFLNTDTKNLN